MNKKVEMIIVSLLFFILDLSWSRCSNNQRIAMRWLYRYLYYMNIYYVLLVYYYVKQVIPNKGKSPIWSTVGVNTTVQSVERLGDQSNVSLLLYLYAKAFECGSNAFIR